MRRVPLCLLALLAAALPGCDGLLFAELQVPSLHATLPSQSFPASDTSDRNDWCDPTVAFNDPPCIQTTLDYDIGGMVPLLTDPSVTYDLRLTDVAIYLSATQAGTDLTGVRSAAISVLTNPDDPASAIVVASYVRPAGTVPAASIGVTGNANVDLGPYLRGGALRVRAQLVIDRPTPAFLADVAAGFSLEVKLDWGSLL